jgi:hypothetical protein
VIWPVGKDENRELLLSEELISWCRFQADTFRTANASVNYRATTCTTEFHCKPPTGLRNVIWMQARRRKSTFTFWLLLLTETVYTKDCTHCNRGESLPFGYVKLWRVFRPVAVRLTFAEHTLLPVIKKGVVFLRLFVIKQLWNKS